VPEVKANYIGMISLPFNMVSNTPVECTLDQKDVSFQNLTLVDAQPMRYHHFFLRKYCTMNAVHDSMVFLPFILLLCPLPMVGVGQMCLRYFRVQKKMDTFYNLIVKESLDREDVEAMMREKSRASYELKQMFTESRGIRDAFIAKGIIQLIVGGAITALLLWILLFGLAPEQVACHFSDKVYVCVVPLANFYYDVVLVANVAVMSFEICNSYTLLWVSCPHHFCSFYKLMLASKAHVQAALDHKDELFRHVESMSRDGSAVPFFDEFFNEAGPDLGLLLSLMASSNGVADGLRMLALFDKEYQQLWKPLGVDVTPDVRRDKVVNVEWDDAPMAPFIADYGHGRATMGRMRVEYTVDLPLATDDPMRMHKYYKTAKPVDLRADDGDVLDEVGDLLKDLPNETVPTRKPRKYK